MRPAASWRDTKSGCGKKAQLTLHLKVNTCGSGAEGALCSSLQLGQGQVAEGAAAEQHAPREQLQQTSAHMKAWCRLAAAPGRTRTRG